MEVSWWYFSSIGGQHASQALTILAIGDARLEMAARKGSGPRSQGGQAQERILLTECPFTAPEHTNTNMYTQKPKNNHTHTNTWYTHSGGEEQILIMKWPLSDTLCTREKYLYAI